MIPLPKLWVVCYDITDDKRRTKVHKLLRGFGDHVQFSVFRCVLSALQQAKLIDRLQVLVKPTEDQVLLIPLGSAGSARAWEHVAIGLPMVARDEVVRIL